MNRSSFLNAIEQAFMIHPAVALLGPRQCGKTTLAKQFANNVTSVHYFDLEDPDDLLLLDNPKRILHDRQGLIVIDEIQRRPDLFPVLRVLIDNNKSFQRYLILGSASELLIQQSSETLAGRIDYIELTPFSLHESYTENAFDAKKLWLRGGFPLSYLAPSHVLSARWRENYIRTFLEKDIPNLGIRIPATMLRRFWMMLAHYHGNLFNASEIGRSLSLSSTTVQHYLDLLSGTFMIRQLAPWHENISKRQVKTKKIYFRDSGLLHTLLQLKDEEAVLRHPKLGASWEGFALEEIIRCHQAFSHECYFWRTHEQAEIDLLIFKDNQRLGFEFKFGDTPKPSRFLKQIITDLKLDSVHIIYPGDRTYHLADNICVIGLEKYCEHIK